LPSCQLHISVNRTAQIYLELHFCVELHTKKALHHAKTANTSGPFHVLALPLGTNCHYSTSTKL